jgi:predicted MFS family arabinose efflux permease
VVSLIGLAIFLMTVRKKGDASMLPLRILKNRNVLVLTSLNVLMIASSMAIFFFLPAYVRGVMGGSATEAALTTTLIGVVGIFLGPVFGRWIAKDRSARGVVTLGTIVRIAVTLAFIFVLSPNAKLWLIYVLMLIAGVYNSQQTVMSSVAPQIQFPASQRVQGNGVVQLGQNVGSAVGMSVFTLIIASQGVADGIITALWVALGLAVVGLLVAQLLRPLPEDEQ